MVDRDRLVDDITDDTLGHGPIERLLADESVTRDHGQRAARRLDRASRPALPDDGPVRRRGAPAPHHQPDRRARSAGAIDESSPMVDARLQDGSRVNAIIPPLSLSGPLVTIRKFIKRAARPRRPGPARHADAARAVEFLDVCLKAELNILISGGTGSGKTTLLNAMSTRDPGRGAHRHDRGRRRAAAQPAPRAAAGEPPAEHRGPGRRRDPRSRAQLAAHAARPDHRRRGPRRRGARHAAGDEHRPRRLALDGAREHGARRALAHRDDGADGGLRPADDGDPPAGRLGRRPRRPYRAHARRRRARWCRSARSSAWRAT